MQNPSRYTHTFWKESKKNSRPSVELKHKTASHSNYIESMQRWIYHKIHSIKVTFTIQTVSPRNSFPLIDPRPPIIHSTCAELFPGSVLNIWLFSHTCYPWIQLFEVHRCFFFFLPTWTLGECASAPHDDVQSFGVKIRGWFPKWMSCLSWAEGDFRGRTWACIHGQFATLQYLVVCSAVISPLFSSISGPRSLLMPWWICWSCGSGSGRRPVRWPSSSCTTASHPATSRPVGTSSTGRTRAGEKDCK